MRFGSKIMKKIWCLLQKTHVKEQKKIHIKIMHPILTDLSCSADTFHCGSQCLSLLKFCDGIKDCLDGSDEPIGCI